MIKQIIDRIKSETPVFFKWVQGVCAALGATAGVVMAMPNYDALPAWMQTVTHDMLAASVLGILISQLTKKNNGTTP